MEYHQDNDYLQSSPFSKGPPSPEPPTPPPTTPQPPYQAFQRPHKKSSVWRVFWGILFALSVLANIGMFLLLIGAFVLIASGQARQYEVAIVREGSPAQKIVVVNLTGIIDDEQADEVYRQLKAARRDRSVRGLVVRVNSPGGTVSGSDRIYEELRKYRQQEGQPVVAFMQGIAASGGYYASVACEQIVAEPTTITGSIGVVLSHFVFEDLLKDKLGVQPVFLVEGAKKDWPSSFRTPTEEELAYIRERVLTPAYERFVAVVRTGRAGTLSAEEVTRLADGSVYTAPKALEVELIDKIGYLDDAIASVMSRAGLSDAQVIEYRRPFSFLGLLNANSQAALKLDRSTLYELSAPQVMYLWNAY
ncbi:MAG: signal peptide peptidase SppA [Sedimentisphaerales bacterium]|nr:signal peptide peptidase SppA [Sedimentisphaerales bacterium]